MFWNKPIVISSESVERLKKLFSQETKKWEGYVIPRKNLPDEKMLYWLNYDHGPDGEEGDGPQQVPKIILRQPSLFSGRAYIEFNNFGYHDYNKGCTITISLVPPEVDPDNQGIDLVWEIDIIKDQNFAPKGGNYFKSLQGGGYVAASSVCGKYVRIVMIFGEKNKTKIQKILEKEVKEFVVENTIEL